MHRPFVSTYEGFKTLAHTPGSDTPQAQRDRANASAAEAWQRCSELEAALRDTCWAIDVMRVQMASWNIEPACNAGGIERSARALLAKSK